MYKYNNYMHPVVPLGSIAATSGWNPLKCLFFKCSFVVIYCSKWHNWGFCCKLNTWNLLFFVFPTRLYELPIFAQSNNFMWFLVSDGAYGALLSSDGTNEWQSFELVVISGCQIIICVHSWQKKWNCHTNPRVCCRVWSVALLQRQCSEFTGQRQEGWQNS